LYSPPAGSVNVVETTVLAPAGRLTLVVTRAMRVWVPVGEP
jgi:hypothetical protein